MYNFTRTSVVFTDFCRIESWQFSFEDKCSLKQTSATVCVYMDQSYAVD